MILLNLISLQAMLNLHPVSLWHYRVGIIMFECYHDKLNEIGGGGQNHKSKNVGGGGHG